MKPGTPGFRLERLQEAREACGLTQAALADLLGVTRQAVSQYERGRDTPRPNRLPRLAEVLGVNPRFFLEPPRVQPRGTVFYRRLFSPATKTARRRADRRFEWLQGLVAYLAEFVQLPAVNFPNVGVSSDPLDINERTIEKAATAARRHWGLGDRPISNLVWLVENNGGLVIRSSLGHHALDAFSEWSPQLARPVFILGSDKDSACRSRFDLAHELGHMVLHASVPANAARRPEIHKLLERQANRFAGALLLPAEEFSRFVTVPNLDLLVTMKPTWKVSVGAMIYRSADLRLVSRDQAQRLWALYSGRGYRKKEPYDDEIEPEYPRLAGRVLTLLLSEGVLTKDEVEYDTMLGAPLIEELVGLPPGYMAAREAGSSVTPMTGSSNPDARASSDRRGQILKFRRTNKGGR